MSVIEGSPWRSVSGVAESQVYHETSQSASITSYQDCLECALALLPPVVCHPLAMIPLVLQQLGQVLPERLLRAEHQGRNLRIGPFRRSLRHSSQPCVYLGPDQDVGVVRRGIDDTHGLTLCHRLPLLGVQFDHGLPPHDLTE